MKVVLDGAKNRGQPAGRYLTSNRKMVSDGAEASEASKASDGAEHRRHRKHQNVGNIGGIGGGVHFSLINGFGEGGKNTIS